MRGRFAVHRISAEESKYKLARVKKLMTGAKGVPYIVTHDGRTIRYPDPLVKANDSVRARSDPPSATDAPRARSTRRRRLTRVAHASRRRSRWTLRRAR